MPESSRLYIGFYVFMKPASDLIFMIHCDREQYMAHDTAYYSKETQYFITPDEDLFIHKH